MARVRFKRRLDIGLVVNKLVNTILTLYVGGTIITEVGNVINGTTSPFYTGLKLIGWTVDTTGLVTSTTGSGILSVVGIIGIASIVMEFVSFKL